MSNTKLIDLAGLDHFGDKVRDWVNKHFLRKENVPAMPDPSDDTPNMDGTATAGEADTYARGDHRHPSDTGKQDVIDDLAGIRSGAALGATAVQTETDPTVPSWAKQTNKPSYDYSEIGNTPDLSDFITRSVNDLTNYYLKSETYTKDEVASLIGAIQQFHYEIYATLPQSGESNVLYLIGPTGTGSDKYEEYVYSNSVFTKIGDTSIDLSGYVTTSALNTALAGYVSSSDLATALTEYTKTSNLATVATSGSYNDLTNKPTNVSAFINDAGYLTQHQSLSGYAKYVLCADEAAYNAISPKQSDTLYLIPES